MSLWEFAVLQELRPLELGKQALAESKRGGKLMSNWGFWGRTQISGPNASYPPLLHADLPSTPLLHRLQLLFYKCFIFNRGKINASCPVFL